MRTSRKVVLEHAPPSDKLYGNPVFGIQVTGNSNSIRAFWTPLRTAGATARAMLVRRPPHAMAGRPVHDADRERRRVRTPAAGAASATANSWSRGAR